jgi:predicted nucleic acid-binding protein
MILVDTSVWIDHLRNGNSRLEDLLVDGKVLCHPFVIGELACGNLAKREEILSLLTALPRAGMADNEEVLHLLESRRLYGRGLGWVDVHLLASALLTECGLWTFDKSLGATVCELVEAV